MAKQPEPKTGRIGICAQCHNKAETKVYPGFNPDPVCENCQKENVALENKIDGQGKPSAIPGKDSTGNGAGPGAGLPSRAPIDDPERAAYLRVIEEKADAEWLKKFIEEVLVKNVLQYDWKTIIRSERWFSVLDLRRYALDLDPDFEKVVKQDKPAPQPQPARARTPKKIRRAERHAPAA